MKLQKLVGVERKLDVGEKAKGKKEKSMAAGKRRGGTSPKSHCSPSSNSDAKSLMSNTVHFMEGLHITIVTFNLEPRGL